jgi:hypothetical protein
MNRYSKLAPISPAKWPSKFEEFGVFYLKRLKHQDEKLNKEIIGDDVLVSKVKSISLNGILLSAIIGFASAFLSVYSDVYFEEANPWVHYGWLIGVTAVATVVEIYLLFLIALKTVYKIADLSNIKFVRDEKTGNEFPFSIEQILARTALELSDPKQDLLGIDAFRRVPNYKMILIGIAYKLKISLSNFILRAIFKRIFGRTVMRVSVSYIAVPITGLCNAWSLNRIAGEARLRIFGYVLSNDISNKIITQQFLSKLSPEAKVGCIRAIANAVVLTRNYHPNMLLLLLRFKDLLGIDQPDEFDDWDKFIKTLETVSEEERFMLLDILTISAAFDGRVSRMEKKYLVEAYKEHYDVYYKRLMKLTSMLKEGRMQEAIALCKIDFIPG